MDWFSSEYFFTRENTVSIETFKQLLQSLLNSTVLFAYISW